MSRLRWYWEVIREALRGFDRDDAWVLSGYIAFSVLLAFFPFLIFASALTGLLIGSEEGTQITAVLFELAPSNIAENLAPVLNEVLEARSGGLLTLSALGAIWVASSGVEAFRTAFDRAYDVRRGRNFFVRRILAVAFVFLGALTFIILGVAVVVGPLLIRVAEAMLEIRVPAAVEIARFALALSALSLFLYALHRHLPSRPMRGVSLWPGIFLTVVLWMAAATGFSIYLSYAPSYSVTYGALAGVIITLLFFYITGAVIIFGAEFNAAVARLSGRFDDGK